MKAKAPWREILLITLFVIAAVQGARLYYHWRNGDLTRMTFWGADHFGIPYFAWVAIVVLPLVLYGLLREVTYSFADGAGLSGGTSGKGPSEAPHLFFQIIADLKEQERELRHYHHLAKESAVRQEQFNEKIISSIESALLTIDKDGRVITFNPAAERLFEQRARDVLGMPYREIFARSPQLIELIEGSLLKDLSYRRQEFPILTQQGEMRHLGAAVTPIKPDEGPAAGVLCLITDLTEIVELQQRIKLRENLAALGEMSAGIAHEFKNALATISGYAQLIAHTSNQSEVQEYNQVIRTEVNALNQIISNFLDFAKPGTLVIEEISLGELVENGVRDLETEEQFGHIRWEVTGTFGAIRGDRVRLKQALQNILRNAAESIPRGAPERSVRIHSTVESQGQNRHCVLQVDDTGHGIPETSLEKIFLPFFTTKPSGTGLGLAITQKTIVQHNGKITVSRRAPGPGTRFTIVLPAL